MHLVLQVLVEMPALVVAFALLNRFSGGGLGWRATFPGRPIYYAGVLAAVALGLLYGITGFLAGLSFLAWRLPGWYASLDMGKVGHTVLRDFLVMSARGLVAFPVFAHAALRGDWWALPLLAVFSLLQGAAYLGASIHYRDDHVPAAEYLSGAIWGATVFFLVAA